MALHLPTGWRWRGAPESGDLLTRVAAARGLRGEALANFLDPDFYASWQCPKALTGCSAAVRRLNEAILKQHSVLIFGDYDADGIPGTAIALRALRALGLRRVSAIIPTRRNGYGLSPALVDEIKARSVDLVVTVDTGISSAAEIAALQESGIDTLITDHHEPPAVLPPGLIVNPKVGKQRYANRDLSGAGVVYKVLWALYEERQHDLTSLKYLLDLVALSTLADLMPLTAENRALVKFGLTVLRRTRLPGLRALLLAGGVAPSQADYRHLSFWLAPRLNAISRLGLDEKERDEKWGSLALALLMADDAAEAERLAGRLHDINESRKQSVVDLSAALDKLASAAADGPVVAYLPEVPVGLLGLLAGSVVDRHRRPAFIMSRDADGTIRGSARSMSGYPSLPEWLGTQGELLQRFGGHREAAGWSLEAARLSDFMNALSTLWPKQPASAETVELVIDAELQPAEATLRAASELQRLAPFGPSNEEPLLCVSGRVAAVRSLGRTGAHWQLSLDDYPGLSMVWFNHRQDQPPAIGQTITLAGRLAINTYREPAPQFIIENAV